MASTMVLGLTVSGPLGRLWGMYNEQLQRRPFLVNMATSATLWAAGDVLADRIRSGGLRAPRACRCLKNSSHQRSTAYTSAFGGLVFGPLGHAWYSWLDRAMAGFGAPGSLKYILAKVVVDSSLWTPIYVGLFIAYSSLLIHQSGVQGAAATLRNDFLPTMAVETIIWPPLMAVLFARVPVSHQLLAVNAATVADVALISWLQSNDPSELVNSIGQAFNH